jgi:hypothetical protein
MTSAPVIRLGLREGADFYNPEIQRWWVSKRQRIIVLTFPTIEDAEAWDASPTLHHLLEGVSS